MQPYNRCHNHDMEQLYHPPKVPCTLHPTPLPGPAPGNPRSISVPPTLAYKWNHTVRSLDFLTNAFEIHPRCCAYQQVITLHGLVVFHYTAYFSSGQL